MNLGEQTNKYNKLISEHLKEIPGKKYAFEITKCCDYSTLIFLYKEDNLSDLYVNVAKHFHCCNIKALYIFNTENERINLSFNSYTTLKDFVIDNTRVDNRNMTPIYDIPLPVVYRIYLDDGHHHDHVHI